MSRVVLIVESNTGELVDVAGNSREGGRYAKFVDRILSSDRKNLNYDGSLEISNGGYDGTEINLRAQTVNVTGDLKVGGKSVPDLVEEQADIIADRITGKDGEVSVEKIAVDGKEYIRISLDPAVIEKLDGIYEAIGQLSGLVTKTDLASVINGISFGSGDTLDTVIGKLRAMVERISNIVSEGQQNQQS